MVKRLSTMWEAQVGSLRGELTYDFTYLLRHCRWILYQLSYQGSPSEFQVKSLSRV